MDAIITELLSLYEPIASTRGISLKAYLSGSGDNFWDGDLIYRLFANLIDNAIKYSYDAVRDERVVNVATQRYSADGMMRCVISSYGVGVLSHELAEGRVFEYGFRGALASDRDRRGTGIGLAEAKRIVVAHGGRIEMLSEPTAGPAFHTRVEVYLP